MKVTSARYELSAFRADDEPPGAGPDVVFLGRSNVGKSSLINLLLGRRGLARTSSTPGRTQSVNFYRVNEALWFVDLPGYGFAKVPWDVQRGWRQMVEGVLERRQDRIAAGVLVVDARHGATELDLTMAAWLTDRGLRQVVVATKADKLSGNGRAATKRELARALGPEVGAGAVLASAETGMGLREIWTRLDEALLGRLGRD